MEKNSFLSEIAKKYNSKIDHVALLGTADRMFGMAWRERNGPEKYNIFINKDRLICSYQIFFVLYHEIAHIVLFHLGYRYYSASPSEKQQYQEHEANAWAFKEMGIVDDQGKVKDEHRACYECLTTLKIPANRCRRGFVF